MKASVWIDRVKESLNLPSDYAAAAAIGISRATVSKYRNSIPTMDEETALKVAHALGINPIFVLADQQMERSKDAEAKTAWQDVLTKLGGMAACVLLASGLGGIPNADAKLSHEPNALSVYTSYQSRKRAKRRSLSTQNLPDFLSKSTWFSMVFPGLNTRRHA